MRLGAFFLLAPLLASGGIVFAQDAASPPQRGGTAVSRSDDQALFEALAAIEDPALEEHRAGDMDSGILVAGVILLFLFFPLGVIVLVIGAIDAASHHHEATPPSNNSSRGPTNESWQNNYRVGGSGSAPWQRENTLPRYQNR